MNCLLCGRNTDALDGYGLCQWCSHSPRSDFEQIVVYYEPPVIIRLSLKVEEAELVMA
jgi:hypothetical protein